MNSLFYVGMDVHKENISLAVIRDNSRTIEFERQIRNEPGRIKKYFTKLQEKSANIICCYEAGPTGFTLYRQLDEMEITCYVAAPSMLPRKPGNRIKTDTRDAVLLAKALRNQEIVNVYIPTRSDEAVRDYLRMCNDMRKDLKRQKQRMMQFLLRLGKKYPTSNRYWTGIFHRWLKTITFTEDIHREVFNEYYTAILEMEAKIERITERIEEISTEAQYAERVSKLKCLKGISTFKRRNTETRADHQGWQFPFANATD